MLTKLGRTRTGQRLARLETTYREQRLKIKKEGIMAALAKMTRDERHDRIRFLIAKGMRAHGLREGDAGYVEAAIRGFEHTWPAVSPSGIRLPGDIDEKRSRENRFSRVRRQWLATTFRATIWPEIQLRVADDE